MEIPDFTRDEAMEMLASMCATLDRLSTDLFEARERGEGERALRQCGYGASEMLALHMQCASIRRALASGQI